MGDIWDIWEYGIWEYGIWILVITINDSQVLGRSVSCIVLLYKLDDFAMIFLCSLASAVCFLQIFVYSYPSRMSCSNSLSPTGRYMGRQAIVNSNTNVITVKRNGLSLASGGTYNSGESLSWSFSVGKLWLNPQSNYSVPSH